MLGVKLKIAGGLLVAGLVLAFTVAPVQGANLDKSLLKEAAVLLDKLRENEVKTVGVLPFRVKKGTRAAGYSTTPLGTSLPGRIENALIVTQGSDERRAIRIIRDALGAAGKAGVGSWASNRTQFAKLFQAEYELAWGNSKVKPDAFITGEVVSSNSDRYHTVVNLELIKVTSWKDGKMTAIKLHTLKMTTDRSMLRDLGYAYAIPRTMIKKKAYSSRQLDQLATDQIDQDEKQNKTEKKQPSDIKKQKHTPDDVAGFKFEIEYDDVKQEIKEIVGGQGAKQPVFRVDAAKPGQKVMMYLTRLDAYEGKLGVVLKINGRSSFDEQDSESTGCKKWLYDLARKDKRDDFAGFYSKGEGGKLTVKPFKVLTKEASAIKAAEMGSKAGFIEIDVFSSGADQQNEKDKDLQKDGDTLKGGGDKDELLISTRKATKVRARSLKEVQEKIAKANNLKLKKAPFTARGGLIFMETEAREADPYKTDELPNATRIGGITIQYWVKESGPKDGGKITD